MKVILNVSRAGVGFVQNAGDVIDVSEREGMALLENGSAVLFREEKRETAVKKQKAEKAAK